MSDQTYSIDTSALLDGLERFYPEAVFPALWEQVDALIDEGRLLASEEVWEEAKKRTAVAKAWMEPRLDALLVPTDEQVATVVRDILSDENHRRLVMDGKGRNAADPFVIAVAEIHDSVVLTGEQAGSLKRPKIPTVCDGRGIPHGRFLELVRREGWSF